jgi:hypothetical protein
MTRTVLLKEIGRVQPQKLLALHDEDSGSGGVLLSAMMTNA